MQETRVAKTIDIGGEIDIVAARMEVRKLARTLGFGPDSQARISLATSSLAHFLDMGGKHDGSITLRADEVAEPGIRVVCTIYCNGSMCDVPDDLYEKLRWMVDEITVEPHPTAHMLQVTLVKRAV